MWSHSGSCTYSKQHICTLCLVPLTCPFVNRNMAACISPGRTPPSLVLVIWGVVLYTFSHTAPYVPFTSPAQILAGRIQPGNPPLPTVCIVSVNTRPWQDLRCPFRSVSLFWDATWLSPNSLREAAPLYDKMYWILPRKVRRNIFAKNSYKSLLLRS